MIRRHTTLLRASLAIADALAAVVLMSLLAVLRLGDQWQETWRAVVDDWRIAAIGLALAWTGVLWSQGLYSLRTHWSFRAQLLGALRASAILGVATFALLFLVKAPDVSRAFLLLLFPGLAATALALRGMVHAFFVTVRRRGRNTRFVLIVGCGPTALRFGRELEAQPALGLRVVGYVNGELESKMDWPYLGATAELAHVLHANIVDEVGVCLDIADWHAIQDIVEACRAEGKIVRIPLAGAVIGGAGTHVEDLNGLPVLSLTQGPDRQLTLATKRAIDVALVIISATAVLPIVTIIAAAILISDGRPVFFSQERVGLHGRRFELRKFRTMIPTAEGRLAELRAFNEISGPAFKITNDPRITPLGRFLRRTSLDELPQLWNVLTGEMSLVGPRPPLPNEVSEYDGWHRRRLSMKPGITGLWQVAHRREPEFDRWVERDLEYIDRWSLWLDARIALRTIPRMLRADGR